MESLARLLNPASALIIRQPTLGLALAAAFTTIFLSIVLGGRENEEPRSVGFLVIKKLARLAWALTLLGLLGTAVTLLRSQVSTTLAAFRHDHGRITEANLAAVRTIWGSEQAQGDLAVNLGYDQDETEEIYSSKDPTEAIRRTKRVHHEIADSPFISERHEVTLRENPRPKGSALYAGYETDCRYTWKLRNPADRAVDAILRFPLPSTNAMFNGLEVMVNEASALGIMRVEDHHLVLDRALKAGEALTVSIAFQSRGLDHWYFQVREQREIRDFALMLKLPDLPQNRLNNPGGCMTPTSDAPLGAGGTLRTYQLDHALSDKGMGIELPTPVQPGALADAKLDETDKAWVLQFAAVLLGLTLARGAAIGALGSTLVGAAVALGYGLIGDLSDTWLGFWGAYLAILTPLLFVLGFILTRTVKGVEGRMIAGELICFGLVFPCLAGLDQNHQMLYLNACALILLITAAGQLADRRGTEFARR